LVAEFTTIDNGIGLSMDSCKVRVDNKDMYSDDNQTGGVSGGSCAVGKDSEWWGFGNSQVRSCGCSFDCYKINPQ